MIGIDTNILIWGLDQTCTPGMERMIDLAKQFFRHVTEEGIVVVIPSQVLAEFLVRNTAEERQEAIAKIDESFPIAPLDFSAANIAAVISSEREHCKAVRDSFGLKRVPFKADINVLASVIEYGATRLVTGDGPEMKALAKGRILVETLEEYVANHITPKIAPAIPATGQQQSLFKSSEIDPSTNGQPTEVESPVADHAPE